MWEFFQTVFEATGILGLACLVEAGLLFLAYRMFQKKDDKVERLQQALLEMSEKRREDVIEEREKYEELSQDLDKSLNLFIKIFKKRNGDNGV